MYRNIRKNKSKLKDIESISKTYFTTSTKLAEQIGECILKVGKYPSFTLQKTKGKLQKHWNGDYSCNYDIWVIRENNSKMSYHNISKANSHRGIQSKIIDYNGMVYCLELEKHHIMLVRRNGKISWCGNCKHDVAAFFEEYSEPVSAPLDPAEERLVNENGYSEAQKIAYKAQEKQRYIERQIRMYKRREAVGLDELSKQKALKIGERFIELSTNQGDIVIDPFCGGGTTAAACYNLGRHCSTSDISKEYIDNAKARIFGHE